MVAKGSQTSVFKVRKEEGWLFLQPGTVALGGLVWWSRNSGERENYCVGESCRMSSEKSWWDARASFIGVHHAKPHCGKSRPQKVPVWGRAQMLLSLSPSSLTRPVSSHPPGILHPQCLSTTSLPSTLELEHLWIFVSLGVLESIPCEYLATILCKNSSLSWPDGIYTRNSGLV